MNQKIFEVMVKSGATEEEVTRWNGILPGGYPGARVIVTEDFEGNNTANQKGTIVKFNTTVTRIRIRFDKKLKRGHGTDGHNWNVNPQLVKLLKEGE